MFASKFILKILVVFFALSSEVQASGDYQIFCEIKTPSGDKVDYATVRLRNAKHPERVILSYGTADGELRIPGLYAGTYIVETPDNFDRSVIACKPVTVTLSPKNTRARVSIEYTGEVSRIVKGYVYDAQGNPLEGATVGRWYMGECMISTMIQTATDENGRYEIRWDLYANYLVVIHDIGEFMSCTIDPKKDHEIDYYIAQGHSNSRESKFEYRPIPNRP